MMAWRPTSLNAICCALWRVVVAIGIALTTDSGEAAAHSSACIPPIDPPETVSRRWMPKESISIFCKRTMSPMVITGNDMANGQPVAGLREEGPVVPRHPPSTLEQITKYLLVSNALPGPIMLSHQPGLPVAERVRESPNSVYEMAARRRFPEGRFQGASGWWHFGGMAIRPGGLRARTGG